MDGRLGRHRRLRETTERFPVDNSTREYFYFDITECLMSGVFYKIGCMKETLRAKYKKMRDALTADYRSKASRKIVEKLFTMPEWKSARVVGVYVSAHSEVETAEIIKMAPLQSKKLRAPKVLSENKMRFFEIASPSDLVKGHFGIMEPSDACKKVGCSTMDVILVPGIAFDKKGYRLGHGLGFYDRFLPRANQTFLIGLAYDKTLAEALPHDGKDFPVHAVVTEKAIFRSK